jgi:hypothetical protein
VIAAPRKRSRVRGESPIDRSVGRPRVSGDHDFDILRKLR